MRFPDFSVCFSPERLQISLSGGTFNQSGSQERPYPGETTAEESDQRIVRHVEHQITSCFSKHGDQGTGNQQIGNQREQYVPLPQPSTGWFARRHVMPATNKALCSKDVEN